MMIDPVEKFKTPDAWREAYSFTSEEWIRYSQYWHDRFKNKILIILEIGLILGYMVGRYI